MRTASSASEFSARRDNLSSVERWLSTLGGLFLLASAARGGGVAGRLARGSAGLSLLTRGATGFCAMKSAMRGEGSFSEGLQEQWRRLSSTAGGVTRRIEKRVQRVTERLDSMESMYRAELQELHSAESQLITLARELMRVIGNPSLAFRIEEYATELQARKAELEQRLIGERLDPRAHPDDAMRALIEETHKMADVCADNVRDAAIAASIQRIIHYKIAGYGAIASYAKALGRINDAQFFAQFSDRDKTIDAEITDIAKDMLNPEAVISAQEGASPELRTH